MPDMNQTPPAFGSAEQFAALRLIEVALSEDLGDVAFIGGRTVDRLADAFSVTTIDSLLDEMPDSLPSELVRDLTCAALIDPAEIASINVVVRREGVFAGGPVAELVFGRLDPTVAWQSLVPDGTSVAAQTVVACASGSLRSLLIGERTALNFLMHLSGVATQTRKFIDAVAGTKAVILDTRKTLPGWRALEKYAVRCGSGTNHRMGLYDGVLIKDNHLAALVRGQSIADAVRQARSVSPSGIAIEVEVDSLEQLRDALVGGPEIVLLDNMGPPMLREAVRLRDEIAPAVRLEASGGITLDNVRKIAETGVNRISIGALTHSAPALDIAFDWPN
ncbi:nicotinate-nucleotide diphosphorylase [Planctomycetia bacterium]|nr:nicotinate-nucleotide diphosphorylase [Planctomycetia bacterium]